MGPSFIHVRDAREAGETRVHHHLSFPAGGVPVGPDWQRSPGRCRGPAGERDRARLGLVRIQQVLRLHGEARLAEPLGHTGWSAVIHVGLPALGAVTRWRLSARRWRSNRSCCSRRTTAPSWATGPRLSACWCPMPSDHKQVQSRSGMVQCAPDQHRNLPNVHTRPRSSDPVVSTTASTLIARKVTVLSELGVSLVAKPPQAAVVVADLVQLFAGPLQLLGEATFHRYSSCATAHWCRSRRLLSGKDVPPAGYSCGCAVITSPPFPHLGPTDLDLLRLDPWGRCWRGPASRDRPSDP